MDKNEYVIWSGGCDSTHILYDLAKKSSADNPIYTLSVIFKNINKEQNKLEKKARIKILENFKKRGFHIRHREIIISRRPDMNSNQPSDWLCIITPFIPNYSNVHFGYVFEDSFWHKKAEFVKAFYALMNIRCCEDHNIGLYFDLEWIHKKEVVNYARRYKFLHLISTCDNPKNGKKCNKCEKCIELKVK